MIFIHNDVVRKNMSVKECIPVLEDAFQKIETGEAMERKGHVSTCICPVNLITVILGGVHPRVLIMGFSLYG